eukprot:TRINITY_DN19513_c0_g1_i1.p1 TRINITY_DN19513_c0_g1~~TRINITY_DN19513_c0_g1_i1.p1  ORF type:complete len:412 (+),score=61.11 TRINITY_DN19513_c0_g1_i1:76-1311(+)
MPVSVRSVRAVGAALAARFESARRRGAARFGAKAAASPRRSPLTGTVPAGATLDAVQEASPRLSCFSSCLRHASAAARRSRSWLGRPAVSESTQTDLPPEPPPALQHREDCFVLAQERRALFTQQSSLSQPELKQAVIDSNASVIAELQCELAALRDNMEELRADLQLLAPAAAQGRTLLSRDEEQARGDVELEMHDARAALMLSFHLSSANGATATDEHRCAQSSHGLVQRSGALAAQLTFAEPTGARSPTYASECLFIDQICHWVGTFVRRDWARVCSTTARAVFKAVLEVHGVWMSVARPLGQFQSEGSAHPGDHRDHGPEPGQLERGFQAVHDLRNRVVTTETGDQRWGSRFALHMELTCILYREMRVRHRQLFIEVRHIVVDLSGVLTTLNDTLKMHDAHVAAAAE